MVQHSKKHRTQRAKKADVMTIPELRRAFESIEHEVDQMIREGTLSHTEQIKQLQHEWKRIFHKDLPDEMANDFLEHRSTQGKSTVRKTRRHHRGGMAPLDHQVRAGVYETPGGAAATSYSDYLIGGFFPPPALSIASDPVKGQAPWPTVPQQMGGGSRRTPRRRTSLRRKGGSLLQQMISRPFGGSSPASIGTDLQDMFHGKEMNGASPPIQPTTYQLGSVYARQATM